MTYKNWLSQDSWPINLTYQWLCVKVPWQQALGPNSESRARARPLRKLAPKQFSKYTRCIYTRLHVVSFARTTNGGNTIPWSRSGNQRTTDHQRWQIRTSQSTARLVSTSTTLSPLAFATSTQPPGGQLAALRRERGQRRARRAQRSTCTNPLQQIHAGLLPRAALPSWQRCSECRLNSSGHDPRLTKNKTIMIINHIYVLSTAFHPFRCFEWYVIREYEHKGLTRIRTGS